MKKAMEQVRRSSRRNKKEEGGSPSAPATAAADSSKTSSSSASANKQGSPEKGSNNNSSSKQQQHQLGMSPDEAALTAKNYRLAKELSELRVRHREECKTVTKLTMENMNLASRCRDAIGQVAMLKRELAIQQRRASGQATTSVVPPIAPPPESPATPSRSQRRSNNKISPTNSQQSKPGTANATEMDRVDRILAKAKQLEGDEVSSTSRSSSPREEGVVEEKKDDGNVIESVEPQPHEDPQPPRLVSSDDYEEEEEEEEEEDNENDTQAESNDVGAVNDDDAENQNNTSADLMEPPALTTTPTQRRRVRELVAAAQQGVVSNIVSPLREQKTTAPIDLDDSEVINDDDSSAEAGEERDDIMPSPLKSILSEKTHSASVASSKSGSSSSSSGVSRSSSSTGGLFPHTASPRPSYNEEYPGDITAAAVRQQHHYLHQPRLGRFQESEAAEDSASGSTEGALPSLSSSKHLNKTKHDKQKQTPSEQTQQRLAPFDRLRQKTGTSVISSIDAFEASFNTDFPESFSPKEGDTPDDDGKSGSTDNDPYNPFSASPQRNEQSHYGQHQLSKPKHKHLQPSSSNHHNRIGVVVESSYRRPTSSREPQSHHLAKLSNSSSNGSDPPGRDKTSTRKSGVNRNNNNGSPVSSASSVGSASSTGNSNPVAAFVSTPSPKPTRSSPVVSGGKSQVALSVARMKQQLFALGRTSPSPQKSENINTKPPVSSTVNGSSNSNNFRTASPVMRTPPQSKRKVVEVPDTEAYRTPSPLSMSNPKSALLSEPTRPEKNGYESSRARYEKATKSASARLTDRVAAISAVVRGASCAPESNMNKESWGSSHSEDDPLEGSSSSRKNGIQIRTPAPAADTEPEARLSPSSLGARASGVKAKIATLEAASPGPSPGSTSSRGLDSSASRLVVVDRATIQRQALYSPGEDLEGDIPMRTNIARFESRSPVPTAKTPVSARSGLWETSPSAIRKAYGSVRGIDASDDDRLRPPSSTGYGRSHHIDNYENAISGSLPRTSRLVYNEGTSGRDAPSWR